MMTTRWKSRGVTLVEVLIVVAIMALISGFAAVFAIPAWKKTRVKAAAIGAGVVRDAAVVDRLESPEDAACPALVDLVAKRKLRAKDAKDPWGSRYDVLCDDEVHGLSIGADRTPRTADDVRDDIEEPDIDRIAKM